MEFFKVFNALSRCTKLRLLSLLSLEMKVSVGVVLVNGELDTSLRSCSAVIYGNDEYQS